MRRSLIAVAGGLVLAVGLHVAWADDIITRQVVCSGTRAHAVTSNPNRLGGFIQNVGTLHANIGRGTVMATLHVGAVYEMTPGYRGGVDCQTQPGTGSTLLEVFEETR